MVVALAKKYGKTSAQILLRWQFQQGVVSNPRTHNTTHMEENLTFFDFEIASDDMKMLSTGVLIPQSPCAAPPDHCCHKVCSDSWGAL